MSKQKVIMTGAAGAALVGATLYATRKNQTETRDSRNMAQQKRDLGLGGAGIGGNRTAGGTERGGSHGSGDGDPGRQITTARSRDKLPSGQIGGGEGSGGSGARRTEIPFTPSSSSGTTRGDQTGPNQKPDSTEKSGWLNSMQSAVSGKRTASRKDEEGLHDTKGISKMGQEIPSKRGPADASN